MKKIILTYTQNSTNCVHIQPCTHNGLSRQCPCETNLCV